MFTYNSVAELFEEMDRTRRRLHSTLDGLDAEQENLRDSPERWSIAEIIEHVAIVEGRIAGLAGKVVGKAEAEGAERAGTDAPFTPIDLREIAERGAREKYTAPETAAPAGGVRVADSLARLTESSAALRLLRPRIEALDLSAYKFPHPAFGPLDLYRWLAVLGLHEERHRRQIEGIKNAQPSKAGGAPEN